MIARILVLRCFAGGGLVLLLSVRAAVRSYVRDPGT